MNAPCEIDDHAGIVAGDPQLRTATLQVTNDYPCAVSGYWSLSIPVGYAGDELGGEIRAYRQVGSAWQEVFGGQQVLVTIGADQTLEVSLLLEGAGWSSDATLSATFHAVNLADEALASGLLPAYEAHDSLTLEVNAVDLAVGSMPAVYEDTLASVIPCNKDYDCGYEDGSSNPLPDNTAPLPTGATPPPAHAGEDDLPAGSLTFPYGFHGTWTMTVPAGLRVWQWTGSAWAEVQSGTAYARSGGGGIGLRVEGLAAGGSAYVTVSAQFTDASDDPIGLPLTDQVKVEVVSVDLQIQDISEYDETTKPAFVIVNDDYDEGNVHPISGEAVTDNGRLNDEIVSVPPGIVASDDDLVSGTLTIAGPSGQHGKWWIEVTGEPSTVDGAGDGPGEYPGYDQYLRVWLPDGTPVPRDAASALPITLNAQAVGVLIEGLAAYYSESSPIRLTAHFTPDGNYPFAGTLPDITDRVLADTTKVEIERTDGGDTDITDKNTTVIVGQHVGLKVVGLLPGAQNLLFSTVQWAIPGRMDGTDTDWAIGNYVQNPDGTSAVVTPISNSDLQSEQIGYYWIKDATKLVVGVDATFYGIRFHCDATFTVVSPIVALLEGRPTKKKPSAVGINPNPGLGGSPLLQFGSLVGAGMAGMTWNAEVNVGRDCAGDIAFTQLIKTDRSETLDSSNASKTMTSGGNFILDDKLGIQYGRPQHVGLRGDPQGITRNDSTGTELTATEKKKGCKEHFQVYLMYHSDIPGSIWVTLGQLEEWFWEGSATKNGPQNINNGWQMDPGSDSSDTPLKRLASYKLPQWKNCFSKLNYE